MSNVLNKWKSYYHGGLKMEKMQWTFIGRKKSLHVHHSTIHIRDTLSKKNCWIILHIFSYFKLIEWCERMSPKDLKLIWDTRNEIFPWRDKKRSWKNKINFLIERHKLKLLATEKRRGIWWKLILRDRSGKFLLLNLAYYISVEKNI